MDTISLRKVSLIVEEYRRLCQDIESMNYPVVNERINHTINGLNLLRRDYAEDNGARNVTAFREEYQQFMNAILQNEELADYQKIVRYSRKIQGNLMVIKDQLKQRPHNVPLVDKLSVCIIILLGDIETRWYI